MTGEAPKSEFTYIYIYVELGIKQVCKGFERTIKVHNPINGGHVKAWWDAPCESFVNKAFARCHRLSFRRIRTMERAVGFALQYRSHNLLYHWLQGFQAER